MLQPGTPFPVFSLPDQNETTHSLKDFSGKWTAVYCYPKDNTSGCSLEAQNFAALFSSFTNRGATVLGISADSPQSHCKFAAKFSLPFVLLSDTEHRLLEALGVWQKKKMAGKEFMGIVRSTFLVDTEGVIRFVWTKVKVAGHAEAVYAKLQELRP
ncbi:MAG: peroxiredoxin [Deltaproteobacteria bacterium]|jgi:peroxiredoxin Q/BCP|nr:peroxiredoxin [Deltaproteobacteria bacterium]